MSILKLLARTIVLFVCSIIQVIGVLTEGIYKLSAKLICYLVGLDDKLQRAQPKKRKTKTEEVPT